MANLIDSSPAPIEIDAYNEMMTAPTPAWSIYDSFPNLNFLGSHLLPQNLDKSLEEMTQTEANIWAQQNPEIAGRHYFPPVDVIIDGFKTPGERYYTPPKFSFRWQLDVIPDSGDIRVEASKEFVEELRASMNERANSKLNEVTSHTVRTVIEVARHLADSLDGYDPDDKNKSPFRDSTVNRVRDLIPVIRALNVNADAQIDKAATDLLAAVGNKSAKQLRTDTDDRKATAAAARKVADNISSIFN